MMRIRVSSSCLPPASSRGAHFGARFLFFLLSLSPGRVFGLESDGASLSRMRDIVEPDPIPWWPPAPGGILILYLLLGAVAYGLYRWHLYRAENRYRRLALRELSELCMSIPDTTSVSALSALLKRTALMGYPRSEVASLSGSSWRSFLEKTSAPFRDASESKLFFSLDAYDPKHLLSLTDEDWAGACQAVGIWIRTHRWLSATAEEERAGA